MQQYPNYLEEEVEDNINLRDQFDKYTAYWRWFVLSIIICLIGAYFYLRYTAPLFEVKSTILIKDDKKGDVTSQLSAFQDLGLFTGTQKNVDNEIEILKSRSLLSKVIKELHLNIQYFTLGRFRDVEKYKDKAITLNYLDDEKAFQKLDTTFNLSINSADKFTLYSENGDKIGMFEFGKKIKTKYGHILLMPNFEENNLPYYKHFKIHISPVSELSEFFRKQLKIAPVNKKASVVELRLKSSVKEKAKDILNTLVKLYNKDAIADKNLVSKNTAQFITERLTIITKELSSIEKNIETFKTKNKLTDITSDSELFLQNVSDNEKSLLQMNTQLQLVNYMNTFIKKHDNTKDLIPANLGFTDVSIGELTIKYNELVLQRNRIFKGSTLKNPVIINIDQQLVSLKQNLTESLKNLKSSVKISLRELNRQGKKLSVQIASVPKQEREFRTMKRQQKIKEALYLYLLQKREEANISLAVTVANAKIIDPAFSTKLPVSPRHKIIYLVGLLLGLLIPFIIIYVRDLFDTKIHGRKELEDKLDIPILGDIPKVNVESEKIIVKDDRSSIAEAFRLLRTNLDFMLAKKNTSCKSIFVTSTLSNEGKSFIAINLAKTLAFSDKKVLLIEMDLRVPKIGEYMGLKNKIGLTHYITNQELTINDIIISYSKINNLDIIRSGVIPPNPAELLMNNRVGQLFEEAKKKYDYIVVDTAPVSLVTDTLLLSNYADLFIYTVRANYLDKRLLNIPKTLYKEKRLINMALLLNDADSKKGYGYGYGYGYGNTVAKKSWWKWIFNMN